MLGYYFVRWRTLANAMASTGISLGFTLWPLLSQYLLDEMGWRNTFLIFGGILLNCCVCGAIMRPIQLASGSLPQSAKPEEEPGSRAEEAQLSNGASPHHPMLQQHTRRTKCFQVLQNYLAFDIFCQNKGYQIYTIGVTWMMMGFACVSTGGGLKWVPAKNAKPYHASKPADAPTSASDPASESQEASTQT